MVGLLQYASVQKLEKKDFCSWLDNCGADVICIQETKVKPGYSGTAIYSKTEPDKIEILGDSRFDDEGRTIMAFFGKFVVISAYFPNSQDAEACLDDKIP